MTTPQYPGYPDDGSQPGGVPGYGAQPGYGAGPDAHQQPGYGPQAGAVPNYGPQAGAAQGYGPQSTMGGGAGMPYYPAGAMGGAPMSVGDGLSWAWSKFKDNALILVVGFGVWAILSNLGFDSRVELNGEEYGFSYGIPFWGYVAPVVRLFSAIVAANMSLKVASGRQLEWNDIFSFPNFGASLLASFLTAVATGVGLILCFIPGIIMAFLLYYSVYFTVDKGMDGIAGMKASWATLSSHVGELFPFALTGVGLYFIGAITLIGWLVTVPLVALLSAYSYVRIQGYDVVR
ncbi:hypothetical protein [Actinomyces oris]|uniref:hypothetical protein n=1 Tax=Actinomyces oris TaxID=544580 RepID=UPI0028524A1E|nr:hypothetical protein [Actinomyces oris]